MKKGSEGVASLFYPPECVLCGRSVPWGRILCPCCEDRLPRSSGAVCCRCEAPLDDPRIDLCLRCGTRVRAFDGAKSLGPYDAGWAELIHAFKFDGEKAVGRWLAARMAEAAEGWTTAADPLRVTHVPMTRQELRLRGFNPSRMLARWVARRMGLREERLLIKTRPTRPQRTLRARERADNLRDAFRAVRSSGSGSVLLVDDILTTGATADECGRTLKAANFDAVYVLTAART